jgi:hypothetical protein
MNDRQRGHPEPKVLFALALHDLPGRERRAVEDHLRRGCSVCRRNLARAEILLAALGRREIQPAPDLLGRRLDRWLDARWPVEPARRDDPGFSAEDLWGGIEEEIARLVMDTALGVAPAGVRSPGTRTRVLAYRTSRLDVDLQVQDRAAAGRVDVTGRLHAAPDGADVPGARVVLRPVSAAVERREAETDRWSLFVFEGVPRGEWELAIETDGGRSVVRSLRL